MKAWFQQFSADPQMEIEARVKGVSKKEFLSVLKMLKGNPHWSSQRETLMMDVAYTGSPRVRGTYDAKAPLESRVEQFLVKTRVNKPLDVTSRDGEVDVRFSLQREVPTAGPPAGATASLYRLKHRYTFVHKAEVAYELTEVRSSSLSEEDAHEAEPEYEVELEWCGQASQGVVDNDLAELMARKYVVKVDDIVCMVTKMRDEAL